MRVVLLSGPGPGFRNATYLRDTLLDRHGALTPAARRHFRVGKDEFRLSSLCFDGPDGPTPVLRLRRTTIPHLTTFTLESILRMSGVEFDTVSTVGVWDGSAIPPRGTVDAVFLSTTFIWDHRSLRRALHWVTTQFPDCPIALGGQYSNLKYAGIMDAYPEVTCVVRGDGEESIPLLLAALRAGGGLEHVPNLVFRDSTGNVRLNDMRGVDLDKHPSPTFPGSFPTVPYESMRGCPFVCRFCSYPFATPEWRYKSASKIAQDWATYSEANGTTFIKAMDSTFTVPPSRLNELLQCLPEVAVAWEAYSRANVIQNEALVEGLLRAHCHELSIGFESMSDRTLGFMDKRVLASHNRKAFDLLRRGGLRFRCSFMTGYPGETPDDFEPTRRFLVDEYAGHFMLSVFSLSDETMPVWRDAERFSIRVEDPDDPDSAWQHVGMDSASASALNHSTLDEIRRANDRAVLMLWQADYQHWLVPHLDANENLRVEKAIERISFLARDSNTVDESQARLRALLSELGRSGIHWLPEREDRSAIQADPAS